jgi:two-component system, OmpR family, response regulator
LWPNVSIRLLDTFRHTTIGEIKFDFAYVYEAMSKPPHILLVEDDRAIGSLVAKALRENGFEVTIAASGKELDLALRVGQPDLMLLDLMLPGEDGLSIARRLVPTRRFPIIMLTARAEEADRILGLEVGADDYIVKPFSTRELMARIRAVLRRGQSRGASLPIELKLYEFEGWRLHTLKREVISPEGERIDLTNAEFDLLLVFCERPREVMSRELLIKLTHGLNPQADDRSIDTLISRLRRKLEASHPSSRPHSGFLKTIRFGGYYFMSEVSRVE